MMRKMSLRTRVIAAIVGVLVLLALAAGSYWLVQRDHAATRAADADKVFTQLDRDQAAFDRSLQAGWTDKDRHYVTADLSQAQLTQLTRTAARLTATAKPYAADTAASVAKRYQAFAHKQATLAKRLRALKADWAATDAVNALFQAPVQAGAASQLTAVVKEATDTKAVAAAATKANHANTTLTGVLLKATAMARAQIAERSAFAKQVAVIAADGTLRDGVTLAQLQAFQAFVAKMTYAGLKDGQQALLTAVTAKVKALSGLKSLDATALQKRVLLAYANAITYARAKLAKARTFYVEAARSGFNGDTYTAEIATLNFQGEGLTPQFHYTLTASADGAYTLTHDGSQVATGNLVADWTAADTAAVTGRPDQILAPTISGDQLKQAILASATADGGDPSQVRFPTPATTSGTKVTVRTDGDLEFQYDAATGAGSFLDPVTSAVRYDAALTTAIWQTVLG